MAGNGNGVWKWIAGVLVTALLGALSVAGVSTKKASKSEVKEALEKKADKSELLALKEREKEDVDDLDKKFKECMDTINTYQTQNQAMFISISKDIGVIAGELKVRNKE